jgi:hypothetical protein
MNTKQTNKYSNSKFEFLLKKSGNIICQRYFNVDNYNSDVLNSIELKELMDSLAGMSYGKFGSCGLIPNFLKKKSVDFLWERYNPYSEFNVENDSVSRDIFENEEFFTFEIRVNRRMVAQSIFSGNYFPTAVRYQVNIKEIIPDIINEITECFSSEEYFVYA